MSIHEMYGRLTEKFEAVVNERQQLLEILEKLKKGEIDLDTIQFAPSKDEDEHSGSGEPSVEDHQPGEESREDGSGG